MSPRIHPLYILIAGLTVALTAAASDKDRSDNEFQKHSRWGPRACSTHAKLLRSACFADRTDDYLVHIADCVYVSSAKDERECRKDAREESREKAEECRDVYGARRDLCDLVGEERFDIEFNPMDFVDPDEIGDGVAPNPYWPLTAGHTHVIIAEGEVTVVTATDEVVDVGG